MRYQGYDLHIPTTNGAAGIPRPIHDVANCGVYIHAAGGVTFDVKVQGKAGDGHDDWCDIDSATANKMVQIPNGFTHVRLYRTTVAGGSVYAVVSGRGARGE